MCHYIFNTKECGHRVKDHVEPHNCPHFQRTQVHCDRDNGDHRNRWTYEDKEVYGICNNCLRDARKTEEAAMEREREQMRAQDLREAKEKEDQLRRGEEELREKNRRENGEAKEQKRRAEKQEEEERQKERQRKLATAKAREEARTKEMERIRLEAEAKDQEDTEKAMRQSLEEHEARLAADMKEAERLSKADVDRQAKLKEDEDFKFMIEKSLAEDEARRQKEVDDTARALRDSALFNAPARNYQDDVYDRTLKATWHRTENHTITKVPRSPSPPAPAPKLHTPPPTPPAPAPKPKPTTSRLPPPPKPTPKPRESFYDSPAVGFQDYDRFKIGNRSAPVHESQKMPETPISPLSPIGSVPIARLGGAIAAADMSIVREAKPSIPGPTAFAGLKKMAGPRKVPPPVPEKSGITGQDPKLAALLAKRKTASEVVEEDAKPAVPAPLARSDSAEARRLAKEDFDKGRKTGWKKDEE